MPIPGSRHKDGGTPAQTRLLLVLAIGMFGAVSMVRAADEETTGSKPIETFTPAALEFFETRVRPLLSDSCLSCHGEKKQASELRLDSRAAAIEGGANGPALVPGNPEESLLIQAVRQTHEDIKMPPKPKGKLADSALDALSDWVKMGAPWPPGVIPTAEVRNKASETHWSFLPVRKVDPPKVTDPAQVATPVDAFILSRLENEGLRPSPRADRRTLIRRATFDLTGLPPTAEEVAAFEADASSDAFARVVDRLLASPAYGERWGRHWLDVARYADSKGYVFQEERRYPYSYTYRDYVIRSFNEDRPYDQFLVEQIAADQLELGTEDGRRSLAGLGFLTVGRRFLNDRNEIIDDRIDVVSRGLLGLTVTCARCHDHKFDPIPTDDYYSLYGVFASSIEPDELPIIGASASSEQARDFERQIVEREKLRDDFLVKKRDEFRSDLRSKAAAYLSAAHELGYNSRNGKLDERTRVDKLAPGRLRALMPRWQEHLATTRANHDPIFAPWHAFAALPAGDFATRAAALSRKLPDQDPRVSPVIARSFADAPPATMAEVVGRYGALLAEAQSRWQERLKQDPAASSLEDADWESIRQVLHAEDGPFAVQTEAITRLVDRKERNDLKAIGKKVDALQVTHPGAPPRAMVMNDSPNPVNPHVFLRGNPGRPGKSVPRQFLELLSGPGRKPFTKGSGRLELARAIATPDNPLTARVMVNRIWLQHFGAGLVTTASDFGLRSDPPSHPELLDYLAGEFVRVGWSVKAMHRLIMLSNAYQQRSDARPDCVERDPLNRLVWKFNRRRLDFESMRDAVLAVSGGLDTAFGGRSVPLTTAPYSGRRTVYGFIDRQNLDGLFRTFDFASPDSTSARRHVTTVPQQALFLMNNPFVLEQARRLAGRIEGDSADPESRVRQLYLLLFGRAPGPHELALGVEFARQQAEDDSEPPVPSGKPGSRGSTAAPLSPWEEYAQVLLMTNEFAFVD